MFQKKEQVPVNNTQLREWNVIAGGRRRQVLHEISRAFVLSQYHPQLTVNEGLRIILYNGSILLPVE